MGETDAWEKERSEASALENSYGGGSGGGVLNIKCRGNLDLDKVKSNLMGESWGNCIVYCQICPFLIIPCMSYTTNSDFVEGAISGERLASPSLSHIYSNYAHNSREAVKIIVKRGGGGP